MSNIFSIKEVEAICNQQGIPQEICFYDDEGNRACFPIDFNSINVTLLVNQQGHHNKFYELYKVLGEDKITFYAVVKYGRIGQAAREYLYTFNSGNEFSDFCLQKKWEKQNKGYTEIVSFEEYKRITGGIHNKNNNNDE